jgi:hypothetical protein
MFDSYSPDNLKNTKQVVEHILQRDCNTRNSDKSLAISVRKYISKKDVLQIEEILALPSYETISRIRRKFQES